MENKELTTMEKVRISIENGYPIEIISLLIDTDDAAVKQLVQNYLQCKKALVNYIEEAGIKDTGDNEMPLVTISKAMYLNILDDVFQYMEERIDDATHDNYTCEEDLRELEAKRDLIMDIIEDTVMEDKCRTQ